MAEAGKVYTLEFRVAGNQNINAVLSTLKEGIRTAGAEVTNYNTKVDRTATSSLGAANSVTAWVKVVDKLQGEYRTASDSLEHLKKGTDEYTATQAQAQAAQKALSSAMAELNAKGVITVNSLEGITKLLNLNTGATAQTALGMEQLKKSQEGVATGASKVVQGITLQEKAEIDLANVEANLARATDLYARQLKMAGEEESKRTAMIAEFSAATNQQQVDAINYYNTLLKQTGAVKNEVEAEKLHKETLAAKTAVVNNQIAQTRSVIMLHAEQTAKAKGLQLTEEQMMKVQMEVSELLNKYNANMQRLNVTTSDRVNSIQQLEKMTLSEMNAEVSLVRSMAEDAAAAKKSGEATKEKTQAAKESEKVAKAEATAINQVMKAYQQTVRPTDELGQKIRILEKNQVSQEKIMKLYADDILKAAGAQNKFNETLDPTVQKLIPVAQEMKKAEEQSQRWASAWGRLKTVALGFMAALGGMRLVDIIISWIKALSAFQVEWERTRMLIDGHSVKIP